MADKSREKASRGKQSLRELPSVEKLLQTPELAELAGVWSQPLVADYVRKVVESCRREVSSGGALSSLGEITNRIKNEIYQYTRQFLGRVLNGTGIIIHTNLGRSPLGDEVLSHMAEVSAGYSNMEYDLNLGRRGRRGTHIYQLLNKLVGCEASLAVNNNAAAVFLILSTLARGREVVVSRGELVQIGGGFRIPEIMKSSGARLVEVGTTNKTSLEDYRRGITDQTALLLRVHQSNFRMEGFVESASVRELASLSREIEIPLVVDLGSGVLLNTEEFGFEHEPTPQEVIRAGADIVSFSGDKLLGGPQAGIIVGRKRFVNLMAEDPLFRTLRLDKIIISGLEKVLVQYLKGESSERIPIWRMVAAPLEELKARAGQIVERVSNPKLSLEIGEGRSSTGGGSLPGATIPSVVIVVGGELSPDHLAARMRELQPPLLGRIEDDRFKVDLRTILPDEDEIVAEHLNSL